jgi:hypothetical protein
VGGKAPSPPIPQPEPSDQYNFTDPEGGIMKAGSGRHFEQGFNARAAAEVERRLMVGDRVSQRPNQKQELVPTVASIAAEVGTMEAVMTESGFFEPQGGQTERRTSPRGTGDGHARLCPAGEDQPPSEGNRSGEED